MAFCTPEQLDSLRRAIVRTIDIREDYVARRRLDPAFCFADANWRPQANDYTALYRQLRDCPAGEIAERLRPLTRNFTGYILPEEISRSDPWVTRWRRWISGVPRRYWFEPLPLPGERGPVIVGVVVNHDTCVYQERMNLLLPELQRLDGKHEPIVFEVGGGYGALALAITRSLPSVRYVICDLPEALLFSGLYLSLAGLAPQLLAPEMPIENLKGPGVALMPNYLFSGLPAEACRIDLAVNTLSMSEMSEHQVRRYAEKLSRMLGERGVFFEQNQDNRHLGMINAPEIVALYFRHVRKAHWRRWWGPSRRPSQGTPHLWSN